MKIYTKRGDHGRTSLWGGAHVAKNCVRIELLGTVDELNSVIGTALSHGPDEESVARLVRTQRQLFALGAFLARSGAVSEPDQPPLSRWIAELEFEIDGMDAVLPKLTHFILPGGSKSGSAVHLARAVCRRAERAFFAESIEDRELVGVYLNRLGDWLFMLARQINHAAQMPEPIWRGMDDPA
jgi:cob(I)alamin adenosyltransferase